MSAQRRRALITGVAGQTGSYLAEQLVSRGWEVHGTARESYGRVPDGVVVHQVDVRQLPRVEALVGEIAPDGVFHLAALSSVAESWAQPVEVVHVNTLGTIALAESLRQVRPDASFVFASSAEIFGPNAEVPQNEETAVNPANPYAVSKFAASAMLRLFRTRGLRASTAILYNHESPRRPMRFVTRKITRTVAEIALGQANELVLGNLEARRDWGWAPDYADALLRISEVATPGDFVVATGHTRSVGEFVSAAFHAVGIREPERYLRVSEEFFRPTDAAELRGDAQKLRRETGWSPTVPFEEIVAAWSIMISPT